MLAASAPELDTNPWRYYSHSPARGRRARRAAVTGPGSRRWPLSWDAKEGKSIHGCAPVWAFPTPRPSLVSSEAGGRKVREIEGRGALASAQQQGAKVPFAPVIPPFVFAPSSQSQGEQPAARARSRDQTHWLVFSGPLGWQWT